jgi:hypothetical protein
MFRWLIVAALLTTSADAQQPQPTASQLANGVAAAVIQMAQTIERQQAEIEQLKKQLAGDMKPERPHTMPQQEQK